MNALVHSAVLSSVQTQPSGSIVGPNESLFIGFKCYLHQIIDPPVNPISIPPMNLTGLQYEFNIAQTFTDSFSSMY